MAKKTARKVGRSTRGGEASGTRDRCKVTYSLPASIVRELEQRSGAAVRGKRRVVAEALAFYVAAQDREALGILHAEAARDPQFNGDNDAVQADFAALDREIASPSR